MGEECAERLGGVRKGVDPVLERLMELPHGDALGVVAVEAHGPHEGGTHFVAGIHAPTDPIEQVIVDLTDLPEVHQRLADGFVARPVAS